MDNARSRFLEILGVMLSAYFTLAFFAASSTLLRISIIQPQPVGSSFNIIAARPTRSVSKMMVSPSILSPSGSDGSFLYYVPPDQLKRVRELDEEEHRWRRRMRKELVGAPFRRHSRLRGRATGEDAPLSQTASGQVETMDVPYSEEELGASSHSKAVGGWERNLRFYAISECEGKYVEYDPLAKPFIGMDPKEEEEFKKNACDMRKDMGIYVRRETDVVATNVSGFLDFSRCWDWNTKAIYVTVLVQYATPSTPDNEFTLVDVVLRPHPRRRSVLGALRGVFLSDAPSEWRGKKYSSATYVEHLETLRNNHDSFGSLQDPYAKMVYFDNAWKYQLESYQSGTLPFRTVELKVRYQVMSYSGWAPLQEFVIRSDGTPFLYTLPRYDILDDEDASVAEEEV